MAGLKHLPFLFPFRTRAVSSLSNQKFRYAQTLDLYEVVLRPFTSRRVGVPGGVSREKYAFGGCKFKLSETVLAGYILLLVSGEDFYVSAPAAGCFKLHGTNRGAEDPDIEPVN